MLLLHALPVENVSVQYVKDKIFFDVLRITTVETSILDTFIYPCVCKKHLNIFVKCDISISLYIHQTRISRGYVFWIPVFALISEVCITFDSVVAMKQ